MKFVRLLPVIISAILIVAHFFRAGQLLLVVVSVAITLLLLVKERWAALAVQGGLVLAAGEWLRTLNRLVEFRQNMGMEWQRMALILGGVAFCTLLSSMVFRLPAMRQRFGFEVRQKES